MKTPNRTHALKVNLNFLSFLSSSGPGLVKVWWGSESQRLRPKTIFSVFTTTTLHPPTQTFFLTLKVSWQGSLSSSQYSQVTQRSFELDTNVSEACWPCISKFNFKEFGCMQLWWEKRIFGMSLVSPLISRTNVTSVFVWQLWSLESLDVVMTMKLVSAPAQACPWVKLIRNGWNE